MIKRNSSIGIFGLTWMVLVLVFSGCNTCKDDCDDCETFDPETCDCIVDIDCRCNNGRLDGDESFIDCGGSCGECICKFDPCSYLTGDDDKVWKFIESVDVNGNPVDVNECERDWTYTFFVQGVVEFGCPQNASYTTMYWKFDDPEAPLEMVFIDGFNNQYGYKIEKLTADTLIILEQLGLSTYVPE